MTSITESLASIEAREKLYFLRSSGSSAPVTAIPKRIDTEGTLVDDSPFADENSEGDSISPLILRSPLSVTTSPTNSFFTQSTSLKPRPTINPNLVGIDLFCQVFVSINLWTAFGQAESPPMQRVLPDGRVP